MAPGPMDGPVCVTGASGFCAAFIVRDLLAAGFIVHGTVRSLSDHRKTSALLALPGAPERLRLFEADLLDGKEVWSGALRGCVACIHTAAPVEIAGDGNVHWRDLADAVQRQVKPAVEGTVAVLAACGEEGIRRVVLTSSLSAVGTAREPFPMLDESCWSDEDYLEETVLTDAGAAYELAKTRQERVAWAMADDHGFELVRNFAFAVLVVMAGYVQVTLAVPVYAACHLPGCDFWAAADQPPQLFPRAVAFCARRQRVNAMPKYLTQYCIELHTISCLC